MINDLPKSLVEDSRKLLQQGAELLRRPGHRRRGRQARRRRDRRRHDRAAGRLEHARRRQGASARGSTGI